MLVSATFTLVTIARKKMIENAKNDKNLETTAKAGENPRSNLAQILYI